MKKKTLITFLAVALFATSSTAVFAETQATDSKPNETIKEKIEERVEAKCDKAEVVIQKILDHYNMNKRDHIQAYNAFRHRYDEIVTKLETDGYDVSKLTDYSITLESKITTFASDLSLFMQSLKDSQKYACGESNGQFLAAAKKSKDILKKIRTDINDIKDFYHDIIRPELMNLRKQAKENSATSETSETSSTQE